MKSTSIREQHTALDAEWKQYGEWEIVDHYGDPIGEHRAVRSSAGLIDLSHRGKLAVAGEDRAKFLQGMVTNDIQALTPGEGCHAALLTVKGKMLADLRCYTLGDRFLVDLDSDVLPTVMQTLDRFIIIEDVILHDATDDYALFGLHGPLSTETLSMVLPGVGLPDIEYATAGQEYAGATTVVARRSYTGEEGYDLYVPKEAAVAVWEALHTAVQQQGGSPFGFRALNTLRMEAGILWYGLDMTEDTFPPEAHLDRTAISYTKGCYIGQETIARIKSRGHCNRFLMGLRLPGENVPDTESKILSGGREVGWITSAVNSPTLNQVIAMGYVRHEVIEAKEPVEVDVGGNRARAEVVELPFYSRTF